MTTSIADLKARAERAVREFEEGRARLFRPDGERLYADGEHEERLRALRGERNAQLREVEAELEGAREGALADVAALEDATALSMLEDGELVRAASAHPLAAAEMSQLGSEGRRARLRSVTRSAPRPDRVAYFLAARGSRAAEEGTETQSVIGELEASLWPDSRREELESARGRLAEADELERAVYLALRDQRSAYDPPYSVPAR